jgi:hypothetical protein
VTQREFAWFITISPGPGSDLVIAFLHSSTAASASRLHDASPTRELSAVEGVLATRSGRQERCDPHPTLMVPEQQTFRYSR